MPGFAKSCIFNQKLGVDLYAGTTDRPRNAVYESFEETRQDVSLTQKVRGELLSLFWDSMLRFLSCFRGKERQQQRFQQ